MRDVAAAPAATGWRRGALAGFVALVALAASVQVADYLAWRKVPWPGVCPGYDGRVPVGTGARPGPALALRLRVAGRPELELHAPGDGSRAAYERMRRALDGLAAGTSVEVDLRDARGEEFTFVAPALRLSGRAAFERGLLLPLSACWSGRSAPWCSGPGRTPRLRPGSAPSPP